MGDVEILRMNNLELTEIAGVGDLEIRVSDSTIVIRWHEDWDNSTVTDKIEVDITNGACRHEYCQEDNFKSASHLVEDKTQTLKALRGVGERLGTFSEDRNRASSSVGKAITVLSGVHAA